MYCVLIEWVWVVSSERLWRVGRCSKVQTTGISCPKHFLGHNFLFDISCGVCTIWIHIRTCFLKVSMSDFSFVMLISGVVVVKINSAARKESHKNYFSPFGWPFFALRPHTEICLFSYIAVSTNANVLQLSNVQYWNNN